MFIPYDEYSKTAITLTKFSLYNLIVSFFFELLIDKQPISDTREYYSKRNNKKKGIQYFPHGQLLLLIS